MAEPFLSEIRIFSFGFPPKGWARCDGQFLPINQNQALFSLLGTRYGGNGQTTFALPNLRGRASIHMGDGHDEGEAAGSSAVTISMQTMPQHLHFLQGTTNNTGNVAPAGGALLATTGSTLYGNAANLAPAGPTSVTSIGGSQAHTNMMPYLVLNFCIALQGIFPSQN